MSTHPTPTAGGYSRGTLRVPREYPVSTHPTDRGLRGLLTGYSEGTPRVPREYPRYRGRRYLNFAQIAGVLGDLKLNWPSEISTVLSFLGLLDFGAIPAVPAER